MRSGLVGRWGVLPLIDVRNISQREVDLKVPTIGIKEDTGAEQAINK
jgi:hypothetical protein